MLNRVISMSFLTLGWVKGNYRLTLATITGFVVAMSIICSTVIIIESNRVIITQTVLWPNHGNERYLSGGDISLSSRITGAPEILDDLKEIAHDAIENAGYLSKIEYYTYYSNTRVRATASYISDFFDITSIYYPLSSTQNISQLLTEGSVPDNSTEVILFRNIGHKFYGYYPSLLSVGEEIILTDTDFIRGITYNNVSVTISGIIDINKSSNEDLWQLRHITGYFDLGGEQCRSGLISVDSYLDDIVSKIFTGYNDSPRNSIGIEIYLNPEKINPKNLEEEKKQLTSLKVSLESAFASKFTGTGWSLIDRIVSRISNLNRILTNYYLTSSLLSIPSFIIALIVTVYSFGLVRSQKVLLIKTMKSRGVSRNQMLLMLACDLVISTIISIILGIIAGLIYYWFISIPGDFGTYLGSAREIADIQGSLLPLFVFGMIIAIMINFRDLRNLSNLQTSTHQEYSLTEEPFWKRQYLDIIILAAGIAGFSYIELVIDNISMLEQSWGALTSLSAVSPFLILLGSVMFVSRIFPVLIELLERISLKIEGGIAAFSLTNLVNHRKIATRAVILITLSLSFAIVSASLAASNNANIEEQNYYRIGADVSFSNVLLKELSHELDPVKLEYIQNNVSGIEKSTVVRSTSSIFQRLGEDKRVQIKVLFIDPDSFYQAVHFREEHYHLSESFEEILGKLKDNDTAIIHAESLAYRNHVFGDNITIKFTVLNSDNKYYDFSLLGSFHFWPTIFPFKSETNEHYSPESIYLISNLATFDSIANNSFLMENSNTHIFAKLSPEANITEIQQQVAEETDMVIRTPILAIENQKDQFSNHLLIAILNNNVVAGIIVILLCIIIFVFYMNEDRREEINIERSLGMKRKQLLIMFIIEIGTVVTVSTGIGIFCGSFFTRIFARFIQLETTIPPPVVIYPTQFTIMVLILIVSTIIISVTALTYMTTKRDISTVIKVE